jgi:mono/diheme cytochrome c family protein
MFPPPIAARTLLQAALLALLAPSGLQAAAGAPRYNRDVLPILAEHCFACHGPDKAGRKGGLQLHLREEAVASVIAPGNAAGSELIARITSEDMDDLMPPPESGHRLSEPEIDILRRWIDGGAAYEQHWAYLPPRRHSPPVAGEAAHPVDRFIRARLAEEGIGPAPEAAPTALIRRLSLDITGLPPTPDEVSAFVTESGKPGQTEAAFSALVDRLLASQHFGEKWARWWLDLAHYGDSDGIRLDSTRPQAWRYRQWVVDALNDGLPFDQFTIQQLAGDLLPDADVSARIATGFLRNTISDRQTGNADPALGRVRQIVDRTSTVGTVWLGLTVACAECHDHKFDALSQEEFYQLYAFFNNAEESNITAPLPGELEAHLPARRAYEKERAALLAPLADDLRAMQAEWERKMLWIQENPGADHNWARAYELLVTGWGRGQGEGQFEGINLIETPPALRAAEQRERLQDFFLKNGKVVDPDRYAELGLAELSKKLEGLARKVPPLSRAQAMAQRHVESASYIHTRGDFRRPGKFVGTGTPAALPPPSAAAGGAELSRLDLARWLVSDEHPLTARVTVNRLWQELFGTGLVSTSENFGMRGERPTHPELLDWLALAFRDGGWSIKQTLRLIVTSQTYRQSSDARPDLDERDPANRLLARQNKLRLPAELLRDASLAAGGILDFTIGGPSVRPPQPESFTKENTRNPWKTGAGADRYRRGLYTYIQRLTPFAMFANFDLPGSSSSCTARQRSNTPLQALNLLNDPTFIEAAQGLAARVFAKTSSGDDPATRVRHAFLIALARPPEARETTRLTDYLEDQIRLFETDPEAAAVLAPEPFQATDQSESAAWVMLASVVLNLHEFIHRE